MKTSSKSAGKNISHSHKQTPPSGKMMMPQGSMRGMPPGKMDMDRDMEKEMNKNMSRKK